MNGTLRQTMFQPFPWLALLIFAFLPPTPATAEVYQRVHVDVLSPTHVTVEREKFSLEELSEAFKARIRGDDKVLAVIYVPLPVDKKLLKEVMAKCRHGGAVAFSIAYKS